MMKRTGIVYGFRASDDPEIRYIGWTSGKLMIRYGYHRLEARKGSKTPVHQWFREVHKRGQVVLPKVIQRNVPVEAEVDEIARRRARGENLLNVSRGGEGARFHGLLDPVKQRTEAHMVRRACQVLEWERCNPATFSSESDKL